VWVVLEEVVFALPELFQVGHILSLTFRLIINTDLLTGCEAGRLTSIGKPGGP
jgi:hypothetical protein